MAENGYDIVTVGGGLGGCALAKVMAEAGARVLVVERETQFRDRVRGEYIEQWGVAEARKLGIYEMLRMSSTIRELTFKRAAAQDIRRAARQNGMRTLLEDGLMKAMKGTTTLEEILGTCHHESSL